MADYFDYGSTDEVVFLYDLRLDDYTFASVGQRAKVVYAENDNGFPSVRIRFQNSGKEFYVDQRFIVPTHQWDDIKKSVVMRLQSVDLSSL